MAMLGFAGMALTELKTQVPAAEQLSGDVVGVLLLSITLTLASLLPKFSSGTSLRVRQGWVAARTAAVLWGRSGWQAQLWEPQRQAGVAAVGCWVAGRQAAVSGTAEPPFGPRTCAIVGHS